MAFDMAPPSPMTRYLLELAGAGSAVPTSELEQPDDSLDQAPTDDGRALRGYDLEFKKKRNRAVLKQILERSGNPELARMATIREDRGEEE